MTWWLIILCIVVFCLVISKSKTGRTYNPPKSIEQCKSDLGIALTSGTKEQQAKAYFDLGIATQASYKPYRSGQTPNFTPLDNAIEHLSKAHDLYESLANYDRKGLALSNIAINYYAKEQDDIAANYFKQSLDVAKSLEFPSWEYKTIQRYLKLLGKMGHMAEADKIMTEYSVRKATKNRS
jgi:tetratricopeptide (TPR) repeat protein